MSDGILLHMALGPYASENVLALLHIAAVLVLVGLSALRAALRLKPALAELLPGEESIGALATNAGRARAIANTMFVILLCSALRTRIADGAHGLAVRAIETSARIVVGAVTGMAASAISVVFADVFIL